MIHQSDHVYVCQSARTSVDTCCHALPNPKPAPKATHATRACPPPVQAQTPRTYSPNSHRMRAYHVHSIARYMLSAAKAGALPHLRKKSSPASPAPVAANASLRRDKSTSLSHLASNSMLALLLALSAILWALLLELSVR